MSLPQASLPLHARRGPVNTDQPGMPQDVDFAAGVAKSRPTSSAFRHSDNPTTHRALMPTPVSIPQLSTAPATQPRTLIIGLSPSPAGPHVDEIVPLNIAQLARNFLREPEFEEHCGQDADTGNGDNDMDHTSTESSEPAASSVALLPSAGSIVSQSPVRAPALYASPLVTTPALVQVPDPTPDPSGQSLSMPPASAFTTQSRPVSVSSPAPAPTITPPPHATASTAGNRKRPKRKLSRELSSLAQLGGEGNLIGTVVVRKRKRGHAADISGDPFDDEATNSLKRPRTRSAGMGEKRIPLLLGGKWRTFVLVD